MTQIAQRDLSARLARLVFRADNADGAEGSLSEVCALDFSRRYRRWRRGFFRRDWFLAQITQMAQRLLSARLARLVSRADNADGAEGSLSEVCALGFSRR